MSFDSENYLVGEELIRIVLESHHVGLIFQRHGIQFFGIFYLKNPDGKSIGIDMSARDSNLNALWSLIGFSVKEIHLDNGLDLTFNDGSRISCISDENHTSGTIQTLDLKTYDEF